MRSVRRSVRSMRRSVRSGVRSVRRSMRRSVRRSVRSVRRSARSVRSAKNVRVAALQLQRRGVSTHEERRVASSQALCSTTAERMMGRIDKAKEWQSNGT